MGRPRRAFLGQLRQPFHQSLPLGFGARYEEYARPGSDEYGYSRTFTYATIPLGINHVFGKRYSPHTFGAGAGLTILARKIPLYCYDGERAGHVIGHCQFMYRRIPVGGGFTWRIGFTPVIGTSGDIMPMVAAGIGYSS